MCPSSPDREDPRERYGTEPASLEEREYLESLVPGFEDEHLVPLHPSVADREDERQAA